MPAIAEGAILRLVGPEQTVQAQIWRLCEHEGRGVQGWVLAQYLQPVEVDADADSAIRIQRYIGPVPCSGCRAVKQLSSRPTTPIMGGARGAATDITRGD